MDEDIKLYDPAPPVLPYCYVKFDRDPQLYGYLVGTDAISVGDHVIVPDEPHIAVVMALGGRDEPPEDVDVSKYAVKIVSK